eukprot:scpid79628/ scgid4628/ 
MVDTEAEITQPVGAEAREETAAACDLWYDQTHATMEHFLPTEKDEELFNTLRTDLHEIHTSTDGKSDLRTHLKDRQDLCSPEVANVVYLGLLDKPADSKETIKLVLDQLYVTYGIGKQLQWILVVGDGKTYDLLLKLQNEYGSELAWLVPFPGDWHTLKAIQPCLLKVYWDAGLKSMAKAMGYKGEGLTSLERCSNFRKCHEFLLLTHEAIGREIQTAYAMANGNTKSGTFQEVKEFAESQDDDLWLFWRNFYYRDAPSYISLWVAIRTGNWDMRIMALKLVAPMFHSLDRTNYLRLVPQHLAHLASMPSTILEPLRRGGFSVSLTGSYFNSVAFDEAHEMCINRDMKMAMVKTDSAYVDRMTFYLPHRAHMLSNFQEQLRFAADEDEPTTEPMSAPPRRQQRLRTFAPATKRKRPISQKERDHKLVTTCLKRRLAWSQFQGQYASGVGEQLLLAPRALTEDGITPRKGVKSTITKVYEERWDGIVSNA